MSNIIDKIDERLKSNEIGLDKKAIEKAAKDILRKNPCHKIENMIDDAMEDYLPMDWEEDFDDEYEAYQEVGRGQAESAIIENLVGLWMKKNKMKLDGDTRVSIGDVIADKCGIYY